MAQSESEVSDNPQIETFSDIEAELTVLETHQPNKNTEFEIGNTVCAISNPSVEGLIIGKWETAQGRTEIILLIPAYKKKGHAPNEAAVIRRDADKLSKRRVRKYAFPLPNLEKWQACLKKNKKDLFWTTIAIQAFNAPDNDHITDSIRASPTDDTVRRNASAAPADNNLLVNDSANAPQSSHYLRKRASLPSEQEQFFAEIPLHEDSDDSPRFSRPSRKSNANSKSPKKKRRGSTAKKYKKYKKSKRALYKSSESSECESSNSIDTDSLSTSESTSSDEAACFFSHRDIWGNFHVKARMKGKTDERKYIRYALHNLYSSYSSMKCVVNDIRSRALASGTKPLTFDLIWLEQHALYLDTLMFESFRGVWKLWNEPIVDELALAFLELLVRVSLRREYLDRLDERVCKWMKKRRIGVSQRYGPVPAYLQQAKITEAGILTSNFTQRRWSTNNIDKPSFNNTYKSSYRQNSSNIAKNNGTQQAKSPVPAQV